MIYNLDDPMSLRHPVAAHIHGLRYDIFTLTYLHIMTYSHIICDIICTATHEGEEEGEGEREGRVRETGERERRRERQKKRA